MSDIDEERLQMLMELVNKARMAEWSKATDLRPVIVRFVGSTPTSCKRGINSNIYGLIV